MGTQFGTSDWKNPAERGYAFVQSSKLCADSVHATAILAYDNVVRCVTAPVQNSWFSVDLIDAYLIPTHYMLRHYSSWHVEALRNWVLEGSLDGNQWFIIQRHMEDDSLKLKGQTHTWPVQNPSNRAFRAFRIRQTGLNSNKHLVSFFFFAAIIASRFFPVPFALRL
jgi:hypothetical protein